MFLLTEEGGGENETERNKRKLRDLIRYFKEFAVMAKLRPDRLAWIEVTMKKVFPKDFWDDWEG